MAAAAVAIGAFAATAGVAHADHAVFRSERYDTSESAGSVEVRVGLTDVFGGERQSRPGETLEYRTADTDAVAGRDYEQTAGTVAFAVGESAKTITIPLLADDEAEGVETFTVAARNSFGNGTWSTTTVFIADDDLVRSAPTTTAASSPPPDIAAATPAPPSVPAPGGGEGAGAAPATAEPAPGGDTPAPGPASDAQTGPGFDLVAHDEGADRPPARGRGDRAVPGAILAAAAAGVAGVAAWRRRAERWSSRRP